MSQVVRDLLSTTSNLFDRSSNVNEELQRLAQNASARSINNHKVELSKIVIGGLDGTSLNLLSEGSGSQNGGSMTGTLHSALSDCRSAIASIKSLHENRDAVCDARAEAIRHHEQTAIENRAKLTEELRESKT